MALFGFVYILLPGASAPDLLGAVLMALSGMSFGWFSLLARGVERPVEANASIFHCCMLPAVAVNFLGVDEFTITPTGLMLAIFIRAPDPAAAGFHCCNAHRYRACAGTAR